jgi:hypothetical protein
VVKIQLEILFTCNTIRIKTPYRYDLSDDEKEDLKKAYEDSYHHVPEYPTSRFRELGFLNHGWLNPYGILYYEQEFLRPEEREYSNLFYEYFVFLYEFEGDEEERNGFRKIYIKRVYGDKDKLDKMVPFLMNMGELFDGQSTLGHEYYYYKIKPNGHIVYQNYQKWLEDNKIFDILSDEEREKILDRIDSAELLSNSEFYAESIILYGSILEYLMLRVVENNYNTELPRNKRKFVDLIDFFEDVDGRRKIILGDYRLSPSERTIYQYFRVERNVIHINALIGQLKDDVKKVHEIICNDFLSLCKKFLT